MKRLSILLLTTLVAIFASPSFAVSPLLPLADEEECADGTCDVPTVNEKNQPVFAIVSPVGYRAVEMIEQAPRLDSLEGKRIALTGGSFMASVTHDELKRLLKEDYPTCEIFTFQEVGTSGPFSVFGSSAQTTAFQSKLRELRIDAVVSGNCGCGLCTTKETGSSIAAEYVGVPSVTIGAPSFIAQIHSLGVSRGVGVLRTAEYPGAFASHTEAELRRNTRETVYPSLVAALTTPITDDERNAYADSGKRPYDEIVYTGTYDEIQEYCQVNNWSDGLPVTPPTRELVAEYLRFTPYAASDVLGVYPLAYRECVAYTVAVNAVMSGVPKEFMPICMALTQALGDGEWRRPLASTHGWTPYAWLNGPLARQLGIDSSQGMISDRRSKALGRFMELMLLNLGGYYVKENRMGTFGYLTPFVFAEDEEACRRVGWAPYAATLGYDVNANTVTVCSALAWGNNVTPATSDPERIMQLVAFDVTEKQQNGLGNTNPQVFRTVLITEPVAQDLAKGYASKDALEDAVVATARRPVAMRAFAKYWANTGSAQSELESFESFADKLRRDPDERVALTPTPEWLRGAVESERIETIATARKGQTIFLVAGDAARNKFMTAPGGGSVTFEIRLPQDWDQLIAPFGYEPLERFESSNANASQPAERTTAQRDAGRLAAPEALADGEYRVMPAMELVTEEGRAYRSANGATAAWSYGAADVANLNASAQFEEFMAAIYPGCSFIVTDGLISSVVLRPVASGRRNNGSALRLSPEMLGDARLFLEIVTRRGRRVGSETPDGATLLVSTRTTRLTINWDGTLEIQDPDGTNLLTLAESELTINRRAPVGASSSVILRASDGIERVLSFVKRDARVVVVSYRAR